MKVKKLIAAVVIAILALFGSAFALCGCSRSKVEPVYKGMSISSAGSTAVALSSASEQSDDSDDESADKPDNGEFERVDDAEIGKKMDDVVKLEVAGDETTRYYVDAGQKFIVEVHLSNPDSYEIVSFTLNNTKYANYMFEKGSTLELLLLEVTAPETSGYLDLTIDAIKYVDGTEIKDVRMDGSKTIKAGVAYTAAPTATVKSSTIETTSASFEFVVTDKQGVIGANPIVAYLTDGEQKIAEKTLNVGENTVIWDNLVMGKAYGYGIGVVYDLVDGKGAQRKWLVEDRFGTLSAFKVINGVATKTSVSFDVQKTGTVGTLKSVKLFDFDDGTLIKSFDGADGFTQDGLLSDHSYLIELAFDYDSGGNTISDTAKTAFTTLAKVAPTIAVSNTNSTKDAISFELDKTDPDGILGVQKVELYDGETLVSTFDKTATEFGVDELTPAKVYKIRIEYTYDLNDGDGVHTDVIEKPYPTLQGSVSIKSIVLLNNNQVRLGEAINLRINFDNTADIEFTNIYVNGQKVEVDGGDRTKYAIVHFVPAEAGLIDFYVDRVDYTFVGVEVNQKIDSEVHVTYPVFNDIDVKFEGVSSSPYEYTGHGVYLSFDNKRGYTIYKINERTDFVKISNNEYYIGYESLNSSETVGVISSIEYGYADYGTATQAFDYNPYDANDAYNSSHYSFTELTYAPIYTAADFVNMQPNKYYVLMNDIDLGEVTIPNQIKLTGKLNGNGYTVSGLHNVIDTSSRVYFDIFEGAGGSAIYDVNFTEMYFNITNSSKQILYMRLLGNVRLYNCTVSGDFNVVGECAFALKNGADQDIKKHLNDYNESNTFNLRTKINGVSETFKKTGIKRAKNNNVLFEDGAVYYRCGDNASILIGAYDNTQKNFVLRDDTIWISSRAFENFVALVSVEIPASVVNIGERAFIGCTGLENVTYADANKITSVGRWAFSDCKNLVEIVIPGCVEDTGEIYANTISGNKNLTTIRIGRGVKSINGSGAYLCDKLTEIHYDGDITEWCQIEDNGSLLNTGNNASRKLFIGGKEVTGNLVIPDGVTSIPQYAFGSLKGITSVQIPSSVTSIGEGAFGGCTSLKSVTYADIGKIASVGNFAFHSCNLTEITVPDCVKNLYAVYAGADNELTEITFGRNVRKIEYFSCNKLSKINYTGDIASWCQIDGVNNLSGVSNKKLFIDGAEIIGEIVIPDGVTCISAGAFRNLKGITSVVFPEGLASIGNFAFDGCAGITSLTIPASVTDLGSSEFALFGGCSGLTSITVAAGNNNFAGLDGILYNKEKTEFLYVPNKLCGEITLPDTITAINRELRFVDNVFKITIPRGVLSIADDSFDGDRLIIYCEIDKAPNGWGNSWNNSVPVVWNCKTNDVANDGKIYTMVDGLRFALTVENNNKVASVVRQPKSISGAIVIPAVVTYKSADYSVIGFESSAFSYCENITSVTIPASIGNVYGVFENCSGLTSIVLPATLKYIGDETFKTCRNFEKVYYCGTAEDWSKVTVYDTSAIFSAATKYFYSATEPELNAEGDAYDGNYWHFASDGKTPVEWVK